MEHPVVDIFQNNNIYNIIPDKKVSIWHILATDFWPGTKNRQEKPPKPTKNQRMFFFAGGF